LVVIGWLRETDVAILALSFDGRYDEKPEAWLPVLAIVRECERQRQSYQFVCTGAGRRNLETLCHRLVRDSGIAANHLLPMEMIDMGGAAGQTEGQLQVGDIAEAVDLSPCEAKNFVRPTWSL
jgi:hypothetical protein